MFVDYNYYKNNFKGNSLTDEEFNKYGNLACMDITANTLSRVTDSTINNYPQELIARIKSCACAISECNKMFDDSLNSLTSSSDGRKTEGIVRSKTAGSVSVTYDTDLSAKYFLDREKQEKIKQSILRLYLSPICINGKMYNLLSKVMDSFPDQCHSCCVF